MKECTVVALLVAMAPFSLPLELPRRLFGPVREIVRLICRFRRIEATPRSAFEFEQRLCQLLREVGRRIVEWAYNDREAGDRNRLPTRIEHDGIWYQRNDRKTANRNVGTLFGTITLMRFLYRPIEELVPCVFPLEIRLGLEAARATAALADRVGQYAAQCTQQTVLGILRRDHNVKWSVGLLRGVTAAVARGMAEHRHEAQVARLLELLEQAFDSQGSRPPILAVGRDGIFAPIRKLRGYSEAAVATASVMDRRGKRLGTVHLGRMPEEGQCTLSNQLTSLIKDVLKGWAGALPRLVYVTDAGHHQTKYYKKVLRRMRDPRSGRRLRWEWVLDYYHACEYITKLAVALFGEGRDALAWAVKMRRWLKDKPRGINRVLHSAAALRNRRSLTGLADSFDKAYDYLSKRIAQLDYHCYRRLHLPIGSGVTEACCKTVFTQRMKQSGMSWDVDSGQAIVDLRVAYLSQTWETARDAYLQSKDVQTLQTQLTNHRQRQEKAALTATSG
jgi:hypothetical protein